MLTNKEIEQVRRELATLGIRDTDFPYASNMTGEELIAIIQDGINKKVGIKDFFTKYLPDDFVERLVEGKSAYQIWIEEGNTGSKQDFLDSLKGADGRNGTNGTNGTNGRDGVDAGFGTPVASVDETSSGKVGVSVSASGPNTAKIFTFTFHNLGKGSGGDDPSGETGRSVVGVDSWFKLTTDETVAATPMNIADPSSSDGGSWSLTAGQTSLEYPYLRCFLQVNFDSALESGYTYTRSAAFTVNSYHGNGDADYQELVDALAELREELLGDLANYDASILALNNALENIRTQISGNIANQLTEIRNRLTQINNSEVGVIVDDPEGLWKLLTSYVDDTNGQKSFSDIVASAKNAKITLQSGSTFFDHTVGGEFTLDGLIGRIDGKVTRQDVNAMIASAQFSVDPSSLNSVISKSQACWKDGDELLYPYDLHLVDYMTDNPTATLADYETYMTAQSGGPSDGPFELVVIVEQFSDIKQAVDSISTSIDTTKYMWQNGSTYASYDAFEDEYDERSSTYSDYTYEQYVINVLGYTKIEVGAALSNVTQTSNEIKSQLGDVGYFWRRAAIGGGYEYARYAVPSNKTRSQYISEQQAAGWTLVEYASRMSVIDQFPDSITSLVKNSALCWVDDTATGDDYCRDYDYWMSYYQDSGSSLSYEEWMAINHSEYELTPATSAVSRIKQTADSITSIVEDIGGIEDAFTAIEQTTSDLSLAVTKSAKCWKSNSTGELVGYENFRTEYNSRPRQMTYEQWVALEKYYTLVDSFTEVSGIKIQGDKIWAAIGDGTDVAASIELLADLGVNDGKIVLSANKVIVDGNLFSHFISTNTDTGSYVEIEDGLITFYDNDGNPRIKIGQEDGDSSPVLKFYSATDSDNPLYDLGPNGLTQLDATYAVAKFVTWRFWHFATAPSVGDRLVSMLRTDSPHDYGTSGVDYPDTSRYWFQYSDAMRVVWLTQSQSAVQYLDPSTGDYSSNNTKYHNNFFLDENFSYNAPDGYYVADYNLWTIGSVTYTANARVLKIVTESGVKKYYYGTMVLSFTADDITYGGYSGTIQSIDVSNLFE